MAIPVAMIVVAVMVAITALWAALTIAFFVLGHNRRMMHNGPWMYRRRVSRGGPGYLPWV